MKLAAPCCMYVPLTAEYYISILSRYLWQAIIPSSYFDSSDSRLYFQCIVAPLIADYFAFAFRHVPLTAEYYISILSRYLWQATIPPSYIGTSDSTLSFQCITIPLINDYLALAFRYLWQQIIFFSFYLGTSNNRISPHFILVPLTAD